MSEVERVTTGEHLTSPDDAAASLVNRPGNGRGSARRHPPVQAAAWAAPILAKKGASVSLRSRLPPGC